MGSARLSQRSFENYITVSRHLAECVARFATSSCVFCPRVSRDLSEEIV